MSWLASIVIGIITAIVGALVAGTVASLAVDWYKVPSREGASGYFVVGFILLAIIVGFILGMVVSRTVAGQPNPGFLKALGLSQAILLGIVGIIGVIARLLADVGPTIGGKDLMVNVEFRWPKGQEPPAAKEQWWVELASVSNHVQRNSEEGPVWREDARLEDGYWIVPGAVNLYTSRGDRTLTLRPDSIFPYGYLTRIPAWPGRKDLAWSPWYPIQLEGGPKLDNEFKYRYRLVQAGEPIRTERVGDFEVITRAESVGGVMYTTSGRTWYAYGTFSILYKGKPLSMKGRSVEGGDPPQSYDQAKAVAVIAGERPALLVMLNAEQGYGELTMLLPEGDSVRTEYVAHGPGVDAGAPLTNDPAVFQRILDRPRFEGRIDFISYASPGLYLFKNAILDTRSRTVRHFEAERINNPIERINPLGVSPDEKSYVQPAYDPQTTDRHVFAVVNTVTGLNYSVPISRQAMRYGDFDDLSPVFVSHYFNWVKDAKGDDSLVAREKVKPLAYRGRFSSYSSDYKEFRVLLAKETLRPAVLDWLVREMGGTEVDSSGDFSHSVQVNGQKVNVSWSKDDGHVGIWLDRGNDMALVDTIGTRFNALLATGKLDQHFVSADSAE